MASKRPFVLLDANILFSPRIRELFFFYFAVADATPFWSVKIIQEWRDNYIEHYSKTMRNKDILSHLDAACKRMKADYPKSEIKLNKKDIAAIEFNRDIDDRHVIAAANKHKVDFVVTNDKDLKGKIIDKIPYLSAKKFLELPQNKVFIELAIRMHVETLNRPKVTISEYKEYLKRNLV